MQLQYNTRLRWAFTDHDALVYQGQVRVVGALGDVYKHILDRGGGWETLHAPYEVSSVLCCWRAAAVTLWNPEPSGEAARVERVIALVIGGNTMYCTDPIHKRTMW